MDHWINSEESQEAFMVSTPSDSVPEQSLRAFLFLYEVLLEFCTIQ